MTAKAQLAIVEQLKAQAVKLKVSWGFVMGFGLQGFHTFMIMQCGKLIL